MLKTWNGLQCSHYIKWLGLQTVILRSTSEGLETDTIISHLKDDIIPHVILCIDLIDPFFQRSCCRTCNEPAEAHVRCYTHQQGSLTISVRCLSSLKLSGERDGKIWMWHRCLKCARKDGVPPATRRVVMSDAAWGLSFGKFLELSFSNHATANRVATCGHSLQKDCLRYYGYSYNAALFDI